MPDSSQVSLRSIYLAMMAAVVEQLRAAVPSLTLVGPLNQSKLRSSLGFKRPVKTLATTKFIVSVHTTGLQLLDNEQQGKLSDETALGPVDFVR